MKRLLPVSCVLLALLVLSVPASAQAIRIIFLHHSCGENLIDEGGVREGLTSPGHEFYDHGYNDDGLRDADGLYTGRDFHVPDDNTDPDGIAEIFAQPLHDPPDNAFSHLMQYDVIAFKSCYPTSNIGSDEQLNEYQGYYLAIRDRMDQHPEKLFVVVTQPPQVPGESDAGEARRARALADWLKSDEFLSGHSNVFTFDFFGLLAGPDNLLRPEYRYDDYDGHPNERANREIGPLFVGFVDQAIQGYFGEGPRPEPIEEPEPVATASFEEPPSAAGVLDDFESGADAWYVDIGEGATVECDLDAETVHGGAASLRMQYDVPSGGWGGCGHSFDSPQDWSSADGLTLWLRSDRAGEWVTLVLFAGNLDDPTPFEVQPDVAGRWEAYAFRWTDFAKSEWVGDVGLAAFDPAQVVSYAFYSGEGEAGTLWVDDVTLAAGQGEPVIAPQPPAADAGGEEPSGAEPPGGRPCAGAALLPMALLSACFVIRRRE